MRTLIVLLAAIHSINCAGLLGAYNPVFEYDVPVAHQQALYSPYHGYQGAYGYHSAYVTPAHAAYTSPAVSHTYSQTQTHPVSYVKPVTYYGSQPAQYYAAQAPYTAQAQYTAQAPSSVIENTRLFVPATARIYRYKSANQQYASAYPQSYPAQSVSQSGSASFSGQSKSNYNTNQQYTNRQPVQYAPQSASGSSNGQSTSSYSTNQQYANAYPAYPAQYAPQTGNSFEGNYYGNGYAPNAGSPVKTRRYQIHRPGIKKEFYDVEERVIVRPAGSALIELDPPIKKTPVNDDKTVGSYGGQQSGSTSSADGSAYRVSDCDGYGDLYPPNSIPDQTPIYEYSPSPPPQAPQGGYLPPAYHPTTFAPPPTSTPQYPTTTPRYPTTTGTTTTGGYPYPTTTPSYSTTTTVPSRTYLPPYQDQTPSSTVQDSFQSTTPGQFTENQGSSSSVSTPKQTDVFISSTTPVSVTIIDKNDDSNSTDSFNNTTSGSNNTTNGYGDSSSYGNGGSYGTPGSFGQTQDIVYAEDGQFEENSSPDQFQNELPPRGDIAQYRVDQPDQFYHELPNGRYTNDPSRPPQVYSHSNGDPSEFNVEEAEVIEIEPKGNRNFTNGQNTTGTPQQQRLIALYTDNGGITEVGQTTNGRYTANNGGNAQYQDAGNVRARVVQVTPAPPTATPTETVNKRRIVVSKPVTTVQEVEEVDNSTDTFNSASGPGQFANSNNFDARSGNYQNANYQNSNQNSNQNYQNANYQSSNDNFNNNNNNNNNYNARYTSQSSGGAGYQNANYQNSNDNFNNNNNNNNYNARFTSQSSSDAGFNQNSNGGSPANANAGYSGNSYSQNFNGGSSSSSASANYEAPRTTNGYYISTTPTTAKQRIIYVQPVSQDFAQKKAVKPKE